MAPREPRGINFTLYDAAIKADDAYHAAIVKVYGETHAGDARYRRHDASELNAALDAKTKADRAWHAEIERSRRES